MTRLKKIRTSLTQFPDVAPPSMFLLALELRSIWEILIGLSSFKTVEHLAAKGEKHPILVLPGLGASDTSTSLLRKFLDDLGYTTYAWELGRNKGLSDEVVDELTSRLEAINGLHAQKVSLIGHSLGGVFARELARLNPNLVRQVITLGSPFSGHPLATTGVHLYEWLSGQRVENIDFHQHEFRKQLPVPATSIYSKLDGVVAWECSIEEHEAGESINLRGCSHIGMGSNPLTMYLIANRLAQPEGHWSKFKPTAIEQIFYGTEDHLINTTVRAILN